MAGACFCPQPTPASGNKNNIFVDSACGNISNLAVSVSITQDLEPKGNFSVQLNTYTPPGLTFNGLAVGSVQYILDFEEHLSLSGAPVWLVEANYQGWGNCTPTGTCSELFGTPTGPGTLGDAGNLGTLRFSPVPAGTVLELALSTNSSGAVTAVTFAIAGFSSITVPLAASQQFPVAGFQLNVVGDFNGNSVSFVAGAGNIEYSAPSGILCATTASPGNGCTNPNLGMFTVENSNIKYLPAACCCGTALSQAFST